MATQDATTLLHAAPPGRATTVVLIVVTGAGLGVTMFRGSSADTVPVTVLSSRAGVVASRWAASLRAVRSPRNALVDIASSSTKFVQSVDPTDRSPHAGQAIDAKHVAVETNTFFEQLNALLAKLDLSKLSKALDAVAAAFDSRGETFGQALADLNSFPATPQPSISAVALTVSVTSCFKRRADTAVPSAGEYGHSQPPVSLDRSRGFR